jgi:hypothetical protein
VGVSRRDGYREGENETSCNLQKGV